ncbi:MAG: hydrogenase maturation protease [Candidatus Eremiobacteraeota bacterium]|nr:hydrogenase maturation protease [Candidatus Eremiobacteraeota bacterium]
MTADIREALRPDPSHPVTIITVGNSLRGDDGVGPYIASRLPPLGEGFFVLDAGQQPERIFYEAAGRPAPRAVILDAADFGGHAGEMRLFSIEEIPATTLSTHTFPLPVLASLLQKDCGSAVIFLGIQAVTFTMGEGLTVEVQRAADALVAFLTSPS